MSNDVTRRRVAHGMAWAIPALAVTAAAPAMAASVCPGIAVTGVVFNSTRDQITVTNSGPVALPAGTTIVWAIQNVRASSTPAAFVLDGLVGVTSTTPPTTIARNATATIVFTRSASLAVGVSVSWRYGLSSFTYNSRVTVSFAGTSLATCPSVSDCVSDRVDVIDSVCPTVPAAGARAAATSAPGGELEPIVRR